MKKKHLLIIDPIAFWGGSKIATQNMLQSLDMKGWSITVVTKQTAKWQPYVDRFVTLHEQPWLAEQSQGIAYLLRHTWIACYIFWVRVRFGPIHCAWGISGPGIDLSLYLANYLLRFPIHQFVHGPVADSRLLGRCLTNATKVFALPSTLKSLRTAIARYRPSYEPGYKKSNAEETALPSHIHTFCNGLPKDSWPTPTQQILPVLFWAASLLRWKGLDLLTETLLKFSDHTRPQTNICYIRPQQQTLAVSSLPDNLNNVTCFNNPTNLDSIRAGSSIFISTSHNEPFGMSILEAMAAGLCVFIPTDGAFWDQHLTYGVNCIKYTANSATDLHQKIQLVQAGKVNYRQIGKNSMKIAELYRAEQQYQIVQDALLETSNDQ